MNILKLMEKTLNANEPSVVERYAAANNIRVSESGEEGTMTREDVKGQLEQLQEFVNVQMTGVDFSNERATFSARMAMDETLVSSDVSIVFPRIINTVLQEPKEPELFLTNQVAEQLELPPKSPTSIEFPLVSALRAYDLAEGAEYKRDEMAWKQARVGMRLGKIGVLTHVTEEVMENSQWPIVTLYLRKMAEAMNRLKEEKLFTAMTTAAKTIIDNESTNSTLRSQGTATDQTWNGTFSYFDLVRMMAAMLVTNNYRGTHLLAHPLMWPTFAQDPILTTMNGGGQMTVGFSTKAPEYNQQTNMLFGLQYVPYYALAFNTDYTLTGAGSAFGSTPVVSDLYLIDKQNSLFMATRGPIEIDEMDEWLRDAHAMKAKQYVGVSVKDGGRAITAARKIRVARNYEASHTVRTKSV